MGPTDPFVAFVLEPWMLVLELATSAPGNAHSNASSDIGVCDCTAPFTVTVWVPFTPPRERNCECHDFRMSFPSEARTNNATGAFAIDALVVHCAVSVWDPCDLSSDPFPLTLQVAGKMCMAPCTVGEPLPNVQV